MSRAVPIPPSLLPVLSLGLLLLSLAAGCAGSRGPGAAPAVSVEEAMLGRVRDAARPLTGGDRDYDALIELIGDSRFVLLGEATHGTHEFYRERARISRRLIREKGFTAIAIEGDWPETSRVNRYVRGEGGDATAEQALSGFDRFPRWMWANADVRDLVAWLREHNAALPVADRAGIYGLDLYNLMGAADGVVEALRGLDPQAARRARQRYRCFARYSWCCAATRSSPGTSASPGWSGRSESSTCRGRSASGTTSRRGF